MMILRRFIRPWRTLLQEESGAALTEFAITLPVFMVILTGILHLGALGQVSVSMAPEAYSLMWEDAFEKSSGTGLEHVTPRGELLTAAENIHESTLEGGVSAVDVLNTAGHAATGVGGHWMESKAYTDLGRMMSGNQIHYSVNNTEAAQRLSRHFQTAGYSNLTSSVIGSDVHRPKFALDDNLFDVDSNVLTNFSTGAEGIIRGALASVMELFGGGPGVFAGIRYGEGVGEWEASVTLSNNWSKTYRSEYRTALSPKAIDDQSIPFVDNFEFGSIGRQQQQYFYYWVTGQTIKNQRVAPDLLSRGFDKDSSFEAPARYE